MFKTVTRLNIEHFRELLAKEVDQAKRQMLLRLLAEEDAKLASLEGRNSKEEKAS